MGPYDGLDAYIIGFKIMKLYGIRHKETKQPLCIDFDAKRRYFDEYDCAGSLYVVTQLSNSPYLESIWLVKDKLLATKMWNCIGGVEFINKDYDGFYLNPGIEYYLSKDNKENYEVFEVHQL
jgi:hypothetical protein